jgi:DNA-binding CsgD family transcriptional regulator
MRPTARTHLQRVFDKTGVRRQAALAQLITDIVRGLPLDQSH